MNINIKATWTGKEQLNRMIYDLQSGIFTLMEGEVWYIAEQTADLMRKWINDSRKNPSRAVKLLESSIDTEEVINDPGRRLVIGIANLDKMVHEAPYFELIDVGGTYVTKETHVVPTTYFADPGSGFITFKKGSSHTITGIGYFDKGEDFLKSKLDILIDTIVTKYTSGWNQK